jgi:hypothetical protein
MEEVQEKKGGGKGKILVALAAVGAAIAALAFWRSRKSGSQDEEDLDDEI